MKYKVGDKVRVRRDLEVGKLYGGYSATRDMAAFAGEVVTVSFVYSSGTFMCAEVGWHWVPEMVEPVDTSEIHITTDGTNVHAILKRDGKVVKRSVAKCSPSDDFDFEAGAELAFHRLFEVVREAPAKPPVFDMAKFVAGKQVVHCPTEHEAQSFVVWAHCNGFRWQGKSTVSDNRWTHYGENSVYYGTPKEISYGRKSMAEDMGKEIVPFDWSMIS